MGEVKYELRPYQKEAVEKIEEEWEKGVKNTLLVLPTGCHARGEKLLMADGSVKCVEDIKSGERLLGADGKARNILYTQSGVAKLYKITPVKGDPFVVTEDHLLTLVRTNERKNPKYPCRKRAGEIIDVSVKDWLSWSNNRKHLYKLFRSGAISCFPDSAETELPLDPYFLGVLLGDGGLKYMINVTTPDPEITEELQKQAAYYDMHLSEEPAGKAVTYTFVSNHKNTGRNGTRLHQDLVKATIRRKGSAEKSVPFFYKTADINTRLEVLAGLIDTDGSRRDGGYEFVSKSKSLAEDVVFLCRSCGLAAYVSETVKRCNDFSGTYFRVSISGDCSIIPCRVERKKSQKRQQKKNVLRTGFSVEEAGEGEYFGFTVDGDNRYLMSDFTVTHNCGKTVVFSSVLEDRIKAGDKALVLAHRDELLSQASDKIYDVCGEECAVEKAKSSSIGTDKKIVVGSIQSLGRKRRLQKFPRDMFDTIVIDEAHHAPAKSYKSILEWFSGAKVLGVTATPERNDDENMGDVFDTVAYEYPLDKAVQEGYLSPIKAVMLPVKIDIRSVGIQKGDYKLGESSSALLPYLEKIAVQMKKYCKGRKTVVFLPLIDTCVKFAEILNKNGFRAAEIDGKSKDRQEILDDFENGKYDVLCNAMLLTEGWDCPCVDCIVVLRPTRSDTLYRQMVGRGMRLYPGKEELLLLDFLWLTDERKLVKDPVSLFKTDKNAEAAKRVKEKTKKGGAVDLLAALSQAEHDIEAEREAAIARALREKEKREKKIVNPLDYRKNLGYGAPQLLWYEPLTEQDKEPITEWQRVQLNTNKIDADFIKTKGEANAYIRFAEKRRGLDLATDAQIRELEKRGFKRVARWTKQDAKEMIALLAAYGWRGTPRFIDPPNFVPTKSAMEFIAARRQDMEQHGYAAYGRSYS